MSRKGVSGYESKLFSAWEKDIEHPYLVGVEIWSCDMSPVLESLRRPVEKHTQVKPGSNTAVLSLLR